ncbi:alpha-L-iduronidase [Drosophila pseudoobscura]|uniref:Alpha-L-iduronidase n=1 Tax=Drosophila pseudoobscura pseudoobscura TaxID=46245 RepID=A0A6I8UKE1_DROPS|nr:alpha-L-iduronidase [Drosophila pseudoobscura]
MLPPPTTPVLLWGLLLFLTATLAGRVHAHYTSGDVVYHPLSHFWTGVGFCPAGDIDHKGISAALSARELQMNLRQIAALPVGAVTHIRIHWLLELVQFLQYDMSGVPKYDFGKFDNFIDFLHEELRLSPVLEFMGNPGQVFTENPQQISFFWDHFVKTTLNHQIVRHGSARMTNWRYETWNEPDLSGYNTLNLTLDYYLEYVQAVRRGLSKAGGVHSHTNLPMYRALRGPAGLFKNLNSHPRCWKLLQLCNQRMVHCPIDVLTFHRKGLNGSAVEVVNASLSLLAKIYKEYPNLKQLPVANDEADPVAGWSTPREFQADVRYGVTLMSTVMQHWHAKLSGGPLSRLESISHDNAFLSYHPHEFTQRTLLAHFRMNETNPPHSQFIQKPVYAALGMLAKLGSRAADMELVNMDTKHSVQVWRTVSGGMGGPGQYMATIFLSPEEAVPKITAFHHKYTLNMSIANESAFITELLMPHNTDPYYLWTQAGSPAYPNANLREAMRRAQTPRLYETGPIWQYNSELVINSASIPLPWAMLLRVCSATWPKLKRPQQLSIVEVTHREVFISWREHPKSMQCLKSYEVWFKQRGGQGSAADWLMISRDWHLPYPSFQYAPNGQTGSVNGFYKVRGVDVFNETSPFSQIVEYLEL